MSLIKTIKGIFLTSLVRSQISVIDANGIDSVIFLKYDKIGDMVVCTPVFRELKQAYPHISISVFASNVNKAILSNNPYIDDIYTYDNNWLKLLPVLFKLRKRKFDVCFEFEAKVVTRAILIAKIIKPKLVASVFKKYGRYNVDAEKLKVYDFYTKENKKDHWSDICLETLGVFNLKSKSSKYDIFLSDNQRGIAKNFIKNTSSEKIKIGINLEGYSHNGEINPDNLRAICQGIYQKNAKILIIILSKPGDEGKIEKLIKYMELNYVVSSYFSILEVSALISELDLVISPDTSIIHIASAFNIPSVSIYTANKNNYRLWAPKSLLNKSVFSNDKETIQGYSVYDVVQSSLELIKEIE